MAKWYSAKLKFRVVTELLSGDNPADQVAEACVFRPNRPRVPVMSSTCRSEATLAQISRCSVGDMARIVHTVQEDRGHGRGAHKG